MQDNVGPFRYITGSWNSVKGAFNNIGFSFRQPSLVVSFASAVLMGNQTREIAVYQVAGSLPKIREHPTAPAHGEAVKRLNNALAASPIITQGVLHKQGKVF